MRRLLAPLAAVALLGLTACGTGVAGKVSLSAGPAESAPAETSAPTSAPKVSYAVETSTLENTIRADDGAELLSYRYDLPVLHAYGENDDEITAGASTRERRALEITQTFNQKFSDLAQEDLTTLSGAAREDYALRAKDQGGWVEPYSEEFSYSAYMTETLVSVSAAYTSYSGGAHGNTVLLGWNFDLNSGAFLVPTDFGSDAKTFSNAVAEELTAQAKARAAEADQTPEMYYWEDYTDILKDWTSYAVSFDEAGMTVNFSPYELACYAAGEQSFTLDWTFLTPLLGEKGRAWLSLPAS